MEKNTTGVSTSWRNNSTLMSVAIFVVTFAVAFFATKYFFSGSSIDKQLKETAIQINKSCPVNVDSETRLDSVASFKDAKIQYHYTLLNIVKEDTAFNAAEAKDFVIAQSQQNLDSNPQMQNFRENDVQMEYVYKDKNGKKVFDFTIRPKTNK